NILSLQEEVAQAIARKIDVTVSPPATLAGTPAPDPEAHEDYLKGRYYLNQRTEDALNRSIDCFQQAIAKDPRYALAYSGLADAYALLGFRGSTPSKDALSRAQAAALKAVALDDALASPHVSLAFIAETYEWNWAAAEREYKRALELNPDDSRAHHWYAGYLMYVRTMGGGYRRGKTCPRSGSGISACQQCFGRQIARGWPLSGGHGTNTNNSAAGSPFCPRPPDPGMGLSSSRKAQASHCRVSKGGATVGKPGHRSTAGPGLCPSRRGKP